jgi:hypothetical protein
MLVPWKHAGPRKDPEAIKEAHDRGPTRARAALLAYMTDNVCGAALQRLCPASRASAAPALDQRPRPWNKGPGVPRLARTL